MAEQVRHDGRQTEAEKWLNAMQETKHRADSLKGLLDEIEERHGLAPQRMDDMAIIDDMTVLACGSGTPARQGHERRAADEQIEAIVKEPDPQPVPDEARWH